VVTKPPVFNFSLDIKDEGDIRRLQADSFQVIATNSGFVDPKSEAGSGRIRVILSDPDLHAEQADP
jgi:hypothetical protein